MTFIHSYIYAFPMIDGDGDSSDHDNHTDEDNDRSKYIGNPYIYILHIGVSL